MKTNKKTKSVGNGEGSLYYSSTLERWVFQYFNAKGERKTLKQKKNETTKQFKTRVTTLKNQLNNGTYIDKSNETVISIGEQFIKGKYIDGITADRSYKRETETLEAIKRTCDNFCNKPIQKVTIKDIENAKENIKKYSNSVISKIWILLSKIFKIASSPSRRIIQFNIMDDIELKKPLSEKQTRKIVSLSLKERQKLIDILDNEERNHKYRNIVKFQYISGMRIGEVLARSTNDLNYNTLDLRIHNTLTEDKDGNIILGKHTKTYNKRTGIDEGERYLPLKTPLFNELMDIIKEQTSGKINNMHNLLFYDYAKNTFISYKDVNSWLLRLNKKYKICKNSLSTHRLRHTALTSWKEQNIPLEAIQYLAGHVEGSKITTDVYIDTSLEYTKNILEKIV